MDFPFEREFFRRTPVYGKTEKNIMKTDVKETDNAYELDIDLPGFKKEEVTAKLENGYQGKYIRRERYTGTMSRSFYVGEDVQQEDIHAKFEDGILKLTVPKENPKKVEEKKYISIEG